MTHSFTDLDYLVTCAQQGCSPTWWLCCCRPVKLGTAPQSDQDLEQLQIEEAIQASLAYQDAPPPQSVPHPVPPPPQPTPAMSDRGEAPAKSSRAWEASPPPRWETYQLADLCANESDHTVLSLPLWHLFGPNVSPSLPALFCDSLHAHVC